MNIVIRYDPATRIYNYLNYPLKTFKQQNIYVCVFMYVCIIHTLQWTYKIAYDVRLKQLWYTHENFQHPAR